MQRRVFIREFKVEAVKLVGGGLNEASKGWQASRAEAGGARAATAGAPSRNRSSL